jgi:hypothetical protein
MEDHEYRGYIISEDMDGYFWVDSSTGDSSYEFESFDAACDWIDYMLDSQVPTAPKLHVYQVSYVTDNGYSDYDIVKAYSKNEAEAQVAEKYSDLAYFAGTIRLDED